MINDYNPLCKCTQGSSLNDNKEMIEDNYKCETCKNGTRLETILVNDKSWEEVCKILSKYKDELYPYLAEIKTKIKKKSNG